MRANASSSGDRRAKFRQLGLEKFPDFNATNYHTSVSVNGQFNYDSTHRGFVTKKEQQ